MTASEACDLSVTLTRELAAIRAERDAWRRVAVAAIHHAHGLHDELDRLRSRYHALLNERRHHREAA